MGWHSALCLEHHKLIMLGSDTHIHKAKVDHLQDLLKKIKTGDDSDSTKKEDVLSTCE